MTVECFLDTNIWVYAVDHSPENDAKHRRALELIGTTDFGTSAQVMQEFYVTVTRKLAVPLYPADATAFLEKLSVFASVPTDYKLIRNAIRNAVTHQISYWDGAVLAAAQQLGARVLYSEDLSHGQVYNGVTVINPFAE